MQMQMKATLTGIQRSAGSGTIEGKALTWDYTKFHLMNDLPSKGENAKGQATQEFRFGTAEEFKKWANIPLPCVVDVELVITTNGKGAQSTEVVALKPEKDARAKGDDPFAGAAPKAVK